MNHENVMVPFSARVIRQQKEASENMRITHRKCSLKKSFLKPITAFACCFVGVFHVSGYLISTGLHCGSMGGFSQKL